MHTRRLVRVCVTGAECTGKTVLAHALGTHFSAPVVEEYGREYFTEKLSRGDASVYPGDLVRVIAEQSHREDTVAATAHPLMICDTDVFTIAVWHARYIGGRRAEIDQLAQMRREQGAGMDLFLLCAPDFPFVPDDIRAGEPLRTAMHQVFIDRLEATGQTYLLVTGPTENRIHAAVEAIDALLPHGAV